MKIMRSALVSPLLLAALFAASLLLSPALLASLYAQEPAPEPAPGAPTAAAPAGASDTPLTFVSVASPAINCFFTTAPSCILPVLNDDMAQIPLAGANGEVKLQFRDFGQGAPGAPAAGLFPYLYRFNLFGAEVTTPPPACITSLTVPFGPITRVDYNEDGALDDIFVITMGGAGAVGLSSAMQTASGAIVMTLSEPLCPGTEKGAHGSYFVGIASTMPPMRVAAVVGATGDAQHTVSTYAPAHARVMLPFITRD